MTNLNPIFGIHEEKTMDQFKICLEKAEFGALMADGHLGYVMPIGGVMAYSNKISPVGVGFDIGCGNMAVKLDIKADQFDISKALDIVQKEISFGVGQKNNNAPKDHELFESDKWLSIDDKHLMDALKKLARQQLGTVGSGNHFVDIFKDEENYIWIGVHFGSRGLGHKIASGFLNLSMDKKWDESVKEEYTLLDINSDLGERYFFAMNLAGEYASAGRKWVCYTLAEKFGGKIIEEVHNHHNFAWKENHNEKEYIVVRKGSTPAFPGQKSFIGGSMGDNSYIVEGLDSDISKNALYSTVHGAGRVMSRSEAAGKIRWKRGKKLKLSEGKISREMMNDWLKKKNVELRGAGTDESPQAYRRLDDVISFHKDTLKILHTLTPIGVVMAGDDEFDPYKD